MVAGFKSGAEWKGNRNGRPKKLYSRDDFTNELFLESKEDIRIIKERVFYHAKNDQPWAMKLVWEYFMTKPKIKEEEETGDHSMAQSLAANLPADVLGQIRELILNSQEGEKE